VMRLAFGSLLLLLVACAAPAETEDAESGQDAITPEMQDGAASEFPETVQILHGNGTDYCTGVLVSDKVVLGAAHCIWGTSYTIKAPFAPGAPTRRVVSSKTLGREYSNDVGAPDVGVLVLDQPITLPRYATLTKIGPAVDGGQSFEGVAVGRGHEARTAPLVRSKRLTITSGKDHGYTTGLRTQYFSTGGDSGGPLYLVKNGRVTHEVVGVERQPEPETDADWFTRIDDAVIALTRR
jgi:secreted trypsin-like serine protease